MAVLNKYANSNYDASGNLVAGLQNAVNAAGGNQLMWAYETWEIAAADDNASVVRFFQGLNPFMIPISMFIACDTGLTGCNDVDLGLYYSRLGVVVPSKVNCFADALDLSSKLYFPGEGATVAYCMKDVAIENRGKMLYQHAGLTLSGKTTPPPMDLALTFNAAGSVAGTISMMITFVQG